MDAVRTVSGWTVCFILGGLLWGGCGGDDPLIVRLPAANGTWYRYEGGQPDERVQRIINLADYAAPTLADYSTADCHACGGIYRNAVLSISGSSITFQLTAVENCVGVEPIQALLQPQTCDLSLTGNILTFSSCPITVAIYSDPGHRLIATHDFNGQWSKASDSVEPPCQGIP